MCFEVKELEVVIATRSTSRGAVTDVVAIGPGVSRRNEGKRIILYGLTGGLYVLQEVSNSGYHNCRVMTLDGRQVEVKLPAGVCACEQPDRALLQYALEPIGPTEAQRVFRALFPVNANKLLADPKLAASEIANLGNCLENAGETISPRLRAVIHFFVEQAAFANALSADD